jgi:hypothetical protein
MPRLDKSLGRVTPVDRDPVGENFGDFFPNNAPNEFLTNFSGLVSLCAPILSLFGLGIHTSPGEVPMSLTKIAENRGTRINVGIVLDVSLLVHRLLWSRRTAAVSCFASKRPSMYSLASARTSLLGAKSSSPGPRAHASRVAHAVRHRKLWETRWSCS